MARRPGRLTGHQLRPVLPALGDMGPDRLWAAYGNRPRCRVVFGQDQVTYEVEIRVGSADRDTPGVRVSATVDDGGGDPAGPVVKSFVAGADGAVDADCRIA